MIFSIASSLILFGISFLVFCAPKKLGPQDSGSRLPQMFRPRFQTLRLLSTLPLEGKTCIGSFSNLDFFKALMEAYRPKPYTPNIDERLLTTINVAVEPWSGRRTTSSAESSAQDVCAI